MTTDTPQCWTCKHFTPAVGNWHCRAFPKGIPEKILSGGHDHTNAYPRDHGVRYERVSPGLETDRVQFTEEGRR